MNNNLQILLQKILSHRGRSDGCPRNVAGIQTGNPEGSDLKTRWKVINKLHEIFSAHAGQFFQRIFGSTPDILSSWWTFCKLDQNIK